MSTGPGAGGSTSDRTCWPATLPTRRRSGAPARTRGCGRVRGPRGSGAGLPCHAAAGPGACRPGFGSAPASSFRAIGQFSIGASSGIGNGPGSDSSGYSVIRTGTRGWFARDDDEVHVEVEPEGLLRPDRRDNRGGVGVDRPRRDVFVPWIVGREDLERAEDAVGLRRVEQNRLPDRLTPAWPVRRPQWRAPASGVPHRTGRRAQGN